MATVYTAAVERRQHQQSMEPEAAPASPPPHGDDWPCDECGNVNYARRTACNRCHRQRPPASPPSASGSSSSSSSKKRRLEIGKAAAEKSKGLFSADDWQCGKCGNVNWARRQQCNVCNAPKFAGEEERTGLGGGYDDRGVVEYREGRHRDDDDDEYDQYGRRRKKSEAPPARNSKPKEKLAEEEAEEEDEEEEEEDDDDDDGDLSKYDLSDWGDAKGDSGSVSASGNGR